MLKHTGTEHYKICDPCITCTTTYFYIKILIKKVRVIVEVLRVHTTINSVTVMWAWSIENNQLRDNYVGVVYTGQSIL